MPGTVKKNSAFFLALGALGAGFSNGLLGAGGGIVLYFTLGALYGSDTKENLVLSSASVMFFCLVSLFFYKGNAALGVKDILAVAAPAAVGGISGAILLKKLPRTVIRKIFSCVLIVGGILMLVR